MTETLVPNTAPARTVVKPRGTKVKARGNAAIVALAFPLVAIAIACVAAPWLGLPSPDAQDLSMASSPPAWLNGGDWAHPLGTDQLGRDVLARMLNGGVLTFILACTGMLAGAIPVAGFGPTGITLANGDAERTVDAIVALAEAAFG